MKNRYIALLMMLSLVWACGKTNEPQPEPEKPKPDEFVIPQAPENVVSSNTFAVEYFSAMPASSKTVSHILGASGKRPMVYVFDNVKYTPGKKTEIVETAMEAKSFPFFLQKGATSFSGNLGTGFLTRYVISGFDGECDGTPFGGPTILTALNTAVSITFYNVTCKSKEQLASVVNSKKSAMYGDAVVYGYCDGDAKELKEFAEGKALSMRFDYTTLNGKTFYTLVQPGYVNRGFDKQSFDGIEYVKILFEKLY